MMAPSDVVTLPTTATAYSALKARVERGAAEIAAAVAMVAAALAVERQLRDTQKGLEDALGVLVDEATDRLIAAVKQEDTPAAVAALDEGGDPNRPGAYREEHAGALMWAAEKDNAELATLLLDRGADVNQCYNQGRTHDGATALMWATGAGHLEVARLLLDRSADPNQAKNDGTTALMDAVQKGHLKVARLLLDRSANPNQAKNDGTTALMIAATEGHLEVARLLLDRSADPNQARNTRHTALMDAAQKGHLEVARLLLDRWADPGADTMVQGDNGTNAIKNAAKEGHLKITQLLALYGASCGRKVVTVANRHGHKSIATCLEAIEGWPALKIAAACRLHVDARLMLKRGTIDPSSYTFAELMATATFPADTLWQGSPAPCPATTALVKAAMSSWSPGRHFLYPQEVRTSVHTVLLVANRLWRRHAAESGVRRSIRRLQMQPHKILHILPNELWCVVFKFFSRSDWPRWPPIFRSVKFLVEGANAIQRAVMDLVVHRDCDEGVSVSTIATALRFDNARIRFVLPPASFFSRSICLPSRNPRTAGENTHAPALDAPSLRFTGAHRF